MDEIRSLLSTVRRVLRSRGRSVDDTDDLVQEAFLRLQMYCRDNAVRTTEAFLVRTALNLSVDQSKRQRVAAIIPGALDSLPLIDPGPLPDEIYAGEERLQRMKAGLEALSPRRREIFMLNRIDGYSFTQIAAQLGITLSTVEKSAAKAILFLTEWMKEGAGRQDS